MAFPDIITKVHKDMIMIGFTTIYIYRKKKEVKIVHNGNMGNTINSVKENVDIVLGKGAFNKLLKDCKSKTEKGSCDYSYTMVMKF